MLVGHIRKFSAQTYVTLVVFWWSKALQWNVQNWNKPTAFNQDFKNGLTFFCFFYGNWVNEDRKQYLSYHSSQLNSNKAKASSILLLFFFLINRQGSCIIENWSHWCEINLKPQVRSETTCIHEKKNHMHKQGRIDLYIILLSF